MNLEQLKYPIGHFEIPREITSETIKNWIIEIYAFTNKIETILENISKQELNFKYRPNGWNIKQLVHHCADSHSNAFIRFKLALTEDNPNIKPYKEALWAELIDGKEDDISYSLMILKGTHHKWTLLLNNLEESHWERTYFHPESKKTYFLKEVVGLYAWHCNHHLEHIKNAINSKGTF